MALGSGPPVGLDIGTSAVRAAQVTSGRGGYSLARFGQVALPPGAVAGGEIADPGAVAEAISQLWSRAKFKNKNVVIGVANQRVVVRQVDLPFLEEKELKSSLKFQVADHIPMPVEDAELDYQVLEDFTSEAGEHMMRVLLVAAASDMVESLLQVVTDAGLQPAGVDITPFAVARATSPAARGESGIAGAEAIVDVGAGITNIVIHHNGEPQFVRILLTGGDDATRSLAQELDVTFDEAEAVKLDLGRGVGNPESMRVMSDRVNALVREVQGSLDYYLSLEDSEPVMSVLLTGGASLTDGFVERLNQNLRTTVQVASPLGQIDVGKSGLTVQQIAHVEPVAAAAVGLAMGSSS